MALFGKKHNPEILQLFDHIVKNGTHISEDEFRINLNDVTFLVEHDKTYSTDEKLKIYELISQMSNCTPGERGRYGRKLRKVLK